MSTLSIPKTTRPSRNRRVLQQLESLESRALLSSVTGYNPDPFISGSGAYDTSGNVWFANINGPNGGSIDQIINGAVVASIDVADTRPKGLVASPNGKFFFIDDNTGNINEVDPANPTAGAIVFAVPNDQPGYSEIPVVLTVTDNGAVWFTTQGAFNEDINGIFRRTDVIGRLDPVTGDFSFTVVNDTDPTIDTAEAGSIAASGEDSVYIGFYGVDDFNFVGQNRIGTAEFSGGSINITAIYDINTGDASADANGYLTSVTTAPDGSVWFNLANIDQTSIRPDHPADRIVHGVISGGNLVQTAYVLTGAVSGTPLAVSSLTFDGNDRLWFNEFQGNATGYFDTTNHTFTTFALPAGPGGATTGPQGLVVSQDPSVTDVWVTTESDGYTLLKIHPDATAITFSGAASNITAAEDTALTNFVLATFTAPPGTYTATVSWGDSTTTAATVVDMGSHIYAVTVSSKTFATQGTYSGLVTIKTSLNAVVGTLAFSSTISDTPLTITSYTVQPLLARIVAAALTFKDDVDASPSAFNVTINWGDTYSSNGIVVRNPLAPGSFVVLGVHQYRRRGTFNVTATVATSEVGASPASVSITRTVTV